MAARSAGASAGTVRHVTAQATAAMGTFRNRIQRHPMVWVSIPPSIGPAALPTPAMPMTRPPASPARLGGRMA